MANLNDDWINWFNLYEFVTFLIYDCNNVMKLLTA